MATALRELAADRVASGSGVPERTLRVAQLPRQSARATSYLTLLAGALTRAGVEVTASDTPGLWRLGWRRTVDVVHLHWLEFIAPSTPGGLRGLALTAIRHARLIVLLSVLRVRGIRVVWTVHNLRPHEPVRPRLESLMSLAVSRLSDALVVHSEYARERIHERWGRKVRVAVIPHGNYIGSFPSEPATREELRGARGIPEDAYVFLAFGQVRPYKCLPGLVTAFRALQRDDVRLLVVGKPVVAAEARRLQEAADGDTRVLLDLREVPDAEVSGLHTCADATVLAYRDVFSSGALLLALSFGLPVVAPDVGTAAELLSDGAGELFAPERLTAALDTMRRADHDARSRAASAVARRYDWERVGNETAALYRSVMRRSADGSGTARR